MNYIEVGSNTKVKRKGTTDYSNLSKLQITDRSTGEKTPRINQRPGRKFITR